MKDKEEVKMLNNIISKNVVNLSRLNFMGFENLCCQKDLVLFQLLIK